MFGKSHSSDMAQSKFQEQLNLSCPFQDPLGIMPSGTWITSDGRVNVLINSGHWAVLNAFFVKGLYKSKFKKLLEPHMW